MPIYLDPSSGGQIEFPDISTNLDSAGGFTFTVKLKFSDLADSAIIAKWGTVGARCFIGYIISGQLWFAVSGNGGGEIFGRQTTSLSLSTGVDYIVVWRFEFAGGSTNGRCWVNGTEATTTSWFGSDMTTLFGGTALIQLGAFDAGPNVGADAEYSNLGLWGSTLSAATCDAISDGSTDPSTLSASSGILYDPLDSLTVVDDWFGYTGTVTGGTLVGGGPGPGPSAGTPNRVLVIM